MKHVVLVALLFAASGCKKEDKASTSGSAAATTAAGGDCGKVVAAVDAMAGGAPMAGAAADVPPKLKEVLLTRCTEDRWPQSVIDCYANDAKDMNGMKKCRAGLAPELSEKLRNDIMRAMAGAAGGMMPPGHGGSAMGSATTGSGSAAGSAGGSAK